MPHETPLIATIVAGLVLSFVFGVLAQRLRLSPLVGYLVAGIAVGPFTPGSWRISIWRPSWPRSAWCC